MPGVEETASTATTAPSIGPGFIIVSSTHLENWLLGDIVNYGPSETKLKLPQALPFVFSPTHVTAELQLCRDTSLTVVCINARFLLIAEVRIPRLRHRPCH